MITIAAINFWFFFLPKLYIELPLSILEFIQKKGQYNMAFPFLGLFIIFLSVAAYYRKRATAQQKKVTEDFWSREDQANQYDRSYN